MADPLLRKYNHRFAWSVAFTPYGNAVCAVRTRCEVLYVGNYPKPHWGLFRDGQELGIAVHVSFEEWRGGESYFRDGPIYRPMWAELHRHKSVSDGDEACLVGCTTYAPQCARSATAFPVDYVFFSVFVRAFMTSFCCLGLLPHVWQATPVRTSAAVVCR
mmetsp:Transcript_89170/g.148789  ORF Transcript_89170/g.148789 Transcript_89170/m.148789 type:complete len:160 (-) Transcript_89170:1241-1720(-)